MHRPDSITTTLATRLCICALTLQTAGAAIGYEGQPEDLHVYLLIGDVTMAGPAAMPENDSLALERCYLLNGDDAWEPARVPLNRHSSIRSEKSPSGLGPGLGFAQAMLEANPEISIGLIVNAGTGIRLEDWHMKSDTYRQSRRRTKIARRSGTLKGVLWHHAGGGFSYARLAPMKTLVTTIRMDQKLFNLPFVAGQVPNTKDSNSLVAALAADVHAVGVATIDGLFKPEQKQFDADGMLGFGRRYAEQMLQIQRTWDARAAAKTPRQQPIFDTHIHAYGNKENGLDSLAAWMATNNVHRCIVHPLTPSRARSDAERAAMLANYKKYEGKIYRFCLIEPDEVSSVEEAVAILKREKAEGAIGFGEHYGRGLMFDDPKNMRLYAACEQVGLPIMFHIDQNKNMDERGLPRLENALKAYPDCIFIAHAYWWLHFPDGTCDRLLRDYPNLYADISGPSRVPSMLNRDRAYTREVLTRNADQILFGSDAGWWSLRAGKAKEVQFDLMEDLDLPDEVRTKIYRTNAERLFGLDE